MNHLHIVSFNVPWPADYGGVIDVFYRIKGLSEAGVKIHLHCYTYGRSEAKVLEELCEEVRYYKRETGFRRQLSPSPYIVASRCSKELISNLQKDDYPILLEGLHNCWVLEQLGGKERHISVRTHNVEHDYYDALADAEKLGWKRLFFRMEAKKLLRYEAILAKADSILAISEKDAGHFRNQGFRNVHLIPPAHGHQQVNSQLGSGEYVLYHGNLSVGENVSAVEYLLENVIGDTEFRFVVAGRNPGEALQRKIAQYKNAVLVANPDDMQLEKLLREAHINLLVTDQSTGVKLKLMNALYNGRHCLVNSKMVEGTGLAEACLIADSPDDLRNEISRLMVSNFDEKALENRRKILQKTTIFEDIKNIIL